MKKQYVTYEGKSFQQIFNLYHDGVLIDTYKCWEGKEYNAYKEQIESEGYEIAFCEEDVLIVKEQYEYLLAHQLVRSTYRLKEANDKG